MTTEGAGGLTLADVRVLGPKGRCLLNVPQLHIAAGELVGIRGPSGAGKSTLLYALAGLAERASGRVLWGPTDILSLSSEQRAGFRAAHIGFIFQDLLLFDELGAPANAALGAMFAPHSARNAITAAAENRLSRLGVPTDARTVASFSGGERQRIAVARALATGPKVVLADEPTASLDRATADLLIADLVTLARDDGVTLIAVSHDPVLLDAMDRVLTLDQGQIQDDTGGRDA